MKSVHGNDMLVLWPLLCMPSILDVVIIVAVVAITTTQAQFASAWTTATTCRTTFTARSSSSSRSRRKEGPLIDILPFQRNTIPAVVDDGRNDYFLSNEKRRQKNKLLLLYSTQTDYNDEIISNEEEENNDTRYKVTLNVVAASGIIQQQQDHTITIKELNVIKDAISSTCQAINEGGGGIISASFAINENSIVLLPPVASTSVPGATGRVLLLSATIIPPPPLPNNNNLFFSTNEEREELLQEIKILISQELDDILFQQQKRLLLQPILISILDDEKDSNVITHLKDESSLETYLESLVIQEVEQYDMVVPITLSTRHNNFISKNDDVQETKFVPSMQIEVDGAMISMTNQQQQQQQNQKEKEEEVVWDTSTILIFDNVVSDVLRHRLLNVVLGRDGNGDDNDNESDDYWDDIQNGPDPNRWQTGGLIDLPSNNENGGTQTAAEEGGGESSGGGVGLSDEAIHNLCFHHHDAISEFETQILSSIFPPKHYKTCRLPPNAIYGDTVSPLTANAPVHGDVYSYHIDADPNVTPPSPWTDIYGRYINRCVGKPRFMSCLVYLNEEWNYELWGGPTRFLDVKTDRYYDVQPKPGRVVIMDQDITHSVVAPKEEALKRPRYSLVWKLVLHPVEEGQDMSFRRYHEEDVWSEEPIYFGSAQRD